MSTESRFEQEAFEESAEEVIEAALWAEWLLEHNNIALRGAAGFLISLYGLDVDEGILPPSKLALDPASFDAVEILEVDRWVTYFAQHSHPGLQEMAGFFPEWYPWMCDLGCFTSLLESPEHESR